MALTLKRAHECIQRGVAKAQTLGFKVAIAVVDDAGHLVACERMDGALWATPEIARAKANAKPLSQAGKISGKITRRKIVDLVAPRLNAACSYSGSQSRRTGWTVRTTKGSPTKIRTSTIPILVLE